MSQDRLFDVGAVSAAPASNPVKAFAPDQTTNARRVLDLARLGYLPEPVLDTTYGLGAMWTRYEPKRLVRMDLDPEKARDLHASYLRLPFADDAFATVMFDPPYKYHSHYDAGDSDVQHRYGLCEFMTRDEMDADICAGAVEALRVARQFLIVKCKDQVTGSKARWQTHMIANALDARLADMLHLPNYSTGVEQHGRQQRHTRRNYSTFMVFVPE